MIHIIGNVLNPMDDPRFPLGDSDFTIAHVCNNQGVMGAGIALFLHMQWPHVAQEFGAWWLAADYNTLGSVHYSTVDLNGKPGWIANMVAQTLEGHKFPLSMPHLEDCIRRVSAEHHNVHCPRFGAGLARGHWEDIAQLIPDQWMVYTLPTEIRKWPTVERYHVAPEFRPHFGGRTEVRGDEAARLYQPQASGEYPI